MTLISFKKIKNMLNLSSNKERIEGNQHKRFPTSIMSGIGLAKQCVTALTYSLKSITKKEVKG